jgi:hypothetical protein
MRSTFSSLAVLASSLLAREVLAGRYDVRKREMIMYTVTDDVFTATTTILVTLGEGDMPNTAALAAATTTATTAVPSVVVTSSAASSSAATKASSGGVFQEDQKSHPSFSPTPYTGHSAIAITPTTSSSTAVPTTLSTAAKPSTTSTTPAAAKPSSTSTYVAAATSGPSTASSTNKRGLAFNDASILSSFLSGSSKVSWAYNWGQTTATLPSKTLEYVPMLWNISSTMTSGWSAAASSAIASGSTHLLGFNEPDLASQADISYTAAATGYQQYMQPFAGKAKLGAPAVTNGGSPAGLTYLGNFLTACTGCTIDFVPIHWYDSATNIDYFKSYVAQAYAAGGNRPIWITEFGASGSTDEQNTFLETVMPWLDSLEYVERYAYFMASDGILLSAGSTLSTLGETFATFT